MFLIPGCGETLRVKGRARNSTEPKLLSDLASGREIPRSALVVSVASVDFQCAKAVRRAQLWNPERRVTPGSLPGPNTILAGVQWNGLKDIFRPR
jgi:predicted pyridoxine 5'-phosphate oxidase superfamily flavin-nucleotide-binding protein